MTTLGSRSQPVEMHERLDASAQRTRALLPQAKARLDQALPQLQAIVDELSAIRAAAVQDGVLLQGLSNGRALDDMLRDARSHAEQVQVLLDAARSEVSVALLPPAVPVRSMLQAARGKYQDACLQTHV